MSVYFTDTDCEIWWEDVEANGIKFLAMPYTICGEEVPYDYGKNTDFHALYEKIRGGAMPTTSALNPQNYIDAFEPWFSKGEDILYVHFSSELSGTFNHLKVAMEELSKKYPERKLTMFDTKQICYSAGALALRGAKLHNAGASDEEVVKQLEVLRDKVCEEFVVDSLAHLRRGGRVSATTAVVGAMLNIKPILECDKDGKITKIATKSGNLKALDFLAERLADTIDLDFEQEIIVADADDAKLAEKAEELIRKRIDDKLKIRHLPIGPVIGAHCGPSTVGLIYFRK